MKKDILFNKGMNYDIPEEMPNDGFYKFMQNGDIDGNESSMFNVVNSKGNKELDIEWPEDWSYEGDPINPFPTRHIIGNIGIGKDIVLFYKSDINNRGTIDLLKFKEYNDDETAKYIRIRLIDIEFDWKNNVKVFGVGRYISPDNIKIYFSEKSNTEKDLNNIRFLNIAPDVVNTKVSEGFLLGDYTRVNNTTLDEMEFIGEFDISQPTFNSFGVGSLRNGSVQYAYRFYNKNGNRTNWSGISSSIPVSVGGMNSTLVMKGGPTSGTENEMNSGKSVFIDIPLDSKYEYIEIVRLWYPSIHAKPEAIICERRKVGSEGTLTYEDSIYKSDYGVIDAAELLNLNLEFNAKSLEIKDKRVYASNIKEDVFDVDFDARVYQFNSVADGQECHLYDEDITLVTTLDGANWPVGVSNIEDDADNVNKSNILEFDEEHETNGQEMYRHDGVNLGASGLNITIGFLTENIDSLIHSYVKTNKIFYNYLESTYLKGLNKLFQSDEIYRFGIVFYNEKGVASPVKYIGDIRMPKKVNNEWYKIPKFYVSTSGTGADGYSWQIVYVKRESQDRTYLTEGVVYKKSDDDNYPCLSFAEVYHPNGEDAIVIKSNMQDFVSSEGFIYTPEFSYAKDLNLQGSRVDYIGYFAGQNRVSSEEASYLTVPEGLHNKINFYSFMSADNRDMVRNINFGSLLSNSSCYVEGTEYTSKMSLFVDTYKGLSELVGISASCIFTNKLPTSFTNSTIERLGIVAIRKEITQYGGRGYLDRFNNSYIPAANIASSNLTESVAYRGDTFVSAFELQRSQITKTALLTGSFDDNNQMYQSETIAFPVESSVNWNYRNDDYYSSLDVYGKFQVREEGLSYYRNEDRMTGGLNPDYKNIYTSFSSLYLYNSSYSATQYLEQFAPVDAAAFVNKELKYTIRYSEERASDGKFDKWTYFKPLNYDEVDTKGGEINYLVNKHNKLFVFQDNALSIARINERVTVPDSSSGSLLIAGSGLALDGFQYLSNDVGVQGINEVIESPSSMYWIDLNNKKLYRFAQQVNSLSDIKGLGTWFKKTLDSHISYEGAYDKDNTSVVFSVKDYSDTMLFDDIYFTVVHVYGDVTLLQGDSSNLLMDSRSVYKIYSKDRSLVGYYEFYNSHSYIALGYRYGNKFEVGDEISLEDYIDLRSSYSLFFNEKLSNFIGIKSFIPNYYVKDSKELITISDEDIVYKHNIGKRGEFYGITYPTILDFNFSIGENSVYDSLNMFIKYFKENKDYEGDVDYEGVENRAANGIQVMSNSKGSDYIELKIKNDELVTEVIDGRATDNFEENTYIENNRRLRDTSGIQIIPYPEYLYNIRKQGEKFVTNIPKIRGKRQDELNRDINYDISGNYIRVRLFFNNIDDRLMKLNKVRLFFNPKIT